MDTPPMTVRKCGNCGNLLPTLRYKELGEYGLRQGGWKCIRVCPQCQKEDYERYQFEQIMSLSYTANTPTLPPLHAQKKPNAYRENERAANRFIGILIAVFWLCVGVIGVGGIWSFYTFACWLHELGGRR